MLSIVIPAFNEQKYLPFLLKSLKSQSFKDYELIVSDNDSSDNTREIAKKNRCILAKGGRPSAARNSGAKKAAGDILFLDADVVLPGKYFLSEFLAKVEKNRLDMATCSVIPLSKKFSHWLFYLMKNACNKGVGLLWPHASGQIIFIKKDLFDKLGGYDESLYLAEEHDLAIRAKKAGARFFFFTDIFVLNSPRRLEKEGFFRHFFKSLLSEKYRLFFRNIRKKIFEYEFGRY